LLDELNASTNIAIRAIRKVRSRDLEHRHADGITLRAVDLRFCLVDVGKGLSLERIAKGDDSLGIRVSSNLFC
jgi:hypothetical protein